MPWGGASRAGADPGRQQAGTRLQRAWPKAAYAEITGARGPSRQPPGEPKPAERAGLERLFRDAPTREAADHRREALTELGERHHPKAGAQRARRGWGPRVPERELAEGERVLGPLARGLEASTHDFQGRQTRGCAEGVNHRVKVHTRRCDGSFHGGRRCPRLTLAWHGDHRFGHT